MHSSQAHYKRYCKELQPEYGSYQVLTRPPIVLTNSHLNQLRLEREHLIATEADKASRLKCSTANRDFNSCLQTRPADSGIEACIVQYKAHKHCLVQEHAIEKDKRRRDTDRFSEDWWTCSYSKDGEVGEQAKPRDDNVMEGALDFAHEMLDSFEES
jgi:hypothetical protein